MLQAKPESVSHTERNAYDHAKHRIAFDVAGCHPLAERDRECDSYADHDDERFTHYYQKSFGERRRGEPVA